jgi:hypothetical protein
MAPDQNQECCAGDTSAPAIPQEDKRLEDDPPLVSPPPARDDDTYMRIALGADLTSAPLPGAVQAGGTAFALDTPLVYPFIPAPTLAMEPLDDDDDRTVAAAASTEPPADHPTPVDDRAAAAENTGPSTPTSTAVTAAGSLGTTPRTSPDDVSTAGRWTSQDDDGEGEGKAEHDDDDGDEARCSLSYVRRVPSDGGEAAYHLLHGQVWRGRAADRKRGWRRHQWVVGG